jgi:hypothetical protein
MAAYVKFNQFVEDLAHKVHDMSADAFTVALTTNANLPVVTNEVLANITEISYTNLSSRVLATPTTTAQTSGTFTQLWPDLVLTASGAVATFRHIIIYNDTPTSPADPLICMYDYGSDLTLASGETLTIAFTTSSFTIA